MNGVRTRRVPSPLALNPVDRKKLLVHLLDNAWHSGQDLSARLGVSRTMVWKGVKRLRGQGLDIESRHGRGYRLLDEIDLLEHAHILDEMGPAANGCRLEVLLETESTNKRLTDRFGRLDLHRCIVLAEYQRNGKGRRGRAWASPFARGLYLSVGWCFDLAPASLNALSLAAGVALAKALAGLGLSAFSLKWPNDLMLGNKKAGGILLEARSETAARCDVVLGVGLNVRLPESIKTALDQPVTDLAEHHRPLPPRSRLAGRILAAQVAMLAEVAGGAMDTYVAAWRKLDCLSGKQAVLHLPGRLVHGRVRGVDDNGLLVLESGGNLRTFSSGELRVRVIQR